MPDITITLTAKQVTGIQYVMGRANEEITAENAAIAERNANLPEGGTPETTKPLYTPKTYVEFVMSTAAASYLEAAGQDVVASRADKLAALDAAKLAQVDAILG